MIIFLVLILILVALFAGVGYLNRNKVYTRTNNLENDSDESNTSSFEIDPEYYTLKNTWKEMDVASAGEGESCYNTQMCNSGECYKNPITNQQACFSKKSDATLKGYTDLVSQDTVVDYSIPKLYTAICSQQSKEGDSYETYYPNNVLEIPTSTQNNVCKDALFQEIVNDTATCYDVDQLHGTKVVELCTAQPNTNNICINDNGDRVYYPEFNTERLKKDLTVCEDNTSINYITLNYNNSPQTINEFENTPSFAANQLFCLQTTSVDYYPSISITKEESDYFLGFEGSWGFVYKVKIDKDNVITNIEKVTKDSFTSKDFQKYDKQTLVNNLKLDFTGRGITYKFPTIKNITSSSFEIWSGQTKLKTVDLGTTVDVSSLSSSFMPDATIDLKPCAPFDPSYSNSKNYSNLAGVNHTDRQRFKVSRFALGSDGKLTPNSDGLVSSIVYRELNYSKGGLYLDYYVDSTTEKLTLRPMNSDANNESKKWLLIKPLDTSPYTIPSGANAWCNYSYDTSSDGGKNFNGKTGVVTPMTSVKVEKGQVIVDPIYDGISNQPNNKLFNTLATGILVATVPGAAALVPLPGLTLGVPILNLTSSGFSLFHWQNGDPSFVHCAQLCNNPMSIIPKVKAVALNSGNLGSNPPGYKISVSTDFAEGDTLFGIDLHLANTCKYYKKYDPKPDAPLKPILSRNIGEIYTDGEVDFIIKDTFEDTYFFDFEYFNLKYQLIMDSSSITNSKDSNYGTQEIKQNVISNIYQKKLQIFSRTVFTETNSSLGACTCDSGEDNIGNMETPGCDISKNTDDTCSPKLSNVVTNLNTKDYSLKDIDKNLNIKLTFLDYYNNTHSNKQAIVLESGKIHFDTVKDSDKDSISINTELYNKLGNPDQSVTSSVILDDDNKLLYDTLGKELSVDLDYSNFTREYRLYNGTDQIAVIEPVIKEDGNIDLTKNVTIIEIDYEKYFNILVGNKHPELTLEEYHTMPYTINDYTILLEYNVPVHNKITNFKFKFSDQEWKIDERAPKDLRGQTNPILFNPGENPISLVEDNVLKHGPSPQQMAYLGSFSDEECSKDVENCESNQYCKLRDGICVGKTLLEKFQEEGLTLDTSQNLDGSLFNQKIEGTNNSAITFLKTLQIEKLNYKKYTEKESSNIKGTGNLKYLERKKFDYYTEQGFGNLGTGTDTQKPVLGRFIPYSYFYPNYRDEFGNERSWLVDRNLGTGTSQVYPYTFYNNLNYTQFIPYGKKSDYQYGFEDEKNIPTF